MSSMSDELDPLVPLRLAPEPLLELPDIPPAPLPEVPDIPPLEPPALPDMPPLEPPTPPDVPPVLDAPSPLLLDPDPELPEDPD